jgi:signal peptidase I
VTVKLGGASSPSAAISGWGWLGAAAAARFYLMLMLGLAVCAFVPMLFALTGSVVQSGSMAPLIEPGDVTLTTGFSTEEATPLGRVITFEAPAGSARPGLVLHRIVAIDDDGQLVTAGDANANPDSTRLSRSDIVGRAVVLVPLIGLPSLWLTTGQIVPLGIWILLTLAALAVESRSLLSTRRRHRAFGSRKVRTGAAGTTVLVAMITMGAVIGTASLGQTAAAFSSQTSSVGSSWAYPAAAPAVRLVFTTNPSATSTGGVAFATQPVIEFRDASGRRTTTGGAVTLELTTPNGAVLSCATNPLTAEQGRAAFTGCSIDKVGLYTLTARSGALITAVSTSVLILTGPAARLQFTTAPSSTTVAATAFAVQPRATVTDAGGNAVTTSSASVTLALTNPSGATLTCASNPRTVSLGVATFSGCSINRTGTYTLIATSGTLAASTSASIVVTPGAAARVVFLVSPSNSSSGGIFPTQPIVAVQDSSGNIVTTSTAAITLSVTGTPGGTTLTCAANPTSASSGTATFSSCAINKKGTYTLTARSGTLTTSSSSTFTVGERSASALSHGVSHSQSAQIILSIAKPEASSRAGRLPNAVPQSQRVGPSPTRAGRCADQPGVYTGRTPRPVNSLRLISSRLGIVSGCASEELIAISHTLKCAPGPPGCTVRL